VNIQKVIKFLVEGKINIFNRWRLMFKIEYIDLSNANLSYIDLSNANLKNADLSNANLKNADLSNANLKNADLSYANLRNANLNNANLSNANLSYIDLSNANLRNADLRNAKFDKKHIIQILYHVGMPCQNNELELDADLERLLNSKMFKKVVSKFHRSDVQEYKGTYKKINNEGTYENYELISPDEINPNVKKEQGDG